MSMKAVKVLVADPTDDGADRIARLLGANPRIEVVGVSRTGAETIRKVALTRPHVVTMDLQFMDMSAAQVIGNLSTMGQRVCVYLIGPHVTRENPMLQDALDAGAFEFLRCRRTQEELETLERQIINTIFVAGLSAAKQIPVKEGLRKTTGLEGLLTDRRVVVIKWGAERLGELPGFFTGVRVGPRTDVLLMVPTPMEKLTVICGDLSTVSRTPVQPMVAGRDLTGGAVSVLGRRHDDVMLGPGPTGRIGFVLQPRTGNEPTLAPSVDVLLKSAATAFRDRVAVVLVGGDGSDGMYGLKAVQEGGGPTLVDDLSVEFISAVRKWLPGARIPQATAPLEELRLLMRELAGS